MARPIKNNADYFSHDADMRNDPRIKALRRKYRLVGYAVWNCLLEVICDSDFFRIEWTPLNIEILSGDFDIEPEELTGIVEYCITLGLLQNEDDFLVCKKLTERFEGLMSKREKRANLRVSDSHNTEVESFGHHKPQTNEVSDVDNPQSKVKESKVKITKVISLEDRDKILEIFFFKNNENPRAEVDKFINHYQSQGWCKKSGVEITDVVALAESWKSEQNKRFPAAFLAMWQELYDALVEKKMLTDFEKVEFKEEILILHATKELMECIESQLPVFSPIFYKYYKNYKLVWKTLK